MSIELVRAVPNSSHGQDDNLTRALVQFRVLRFRIHEFAKAISDTNAVKGRVERGEVAAAIQPVPINQIRIALLGPAARRAEKLFREGAAAHRNSNRFTVAFVEAFPI